ncbi:MAG: transcriptional regulator [Oceanospirillaceae bacterium]|nr:transcriptional regulator [Oceanospirillaceae bacterium]
MNELTRVQGLPLELERDIFLRNLLRELSGTLEELVGLEEASGYISIVGQKIGDWMNREYRDALQLDKLPVETLASVLVDLKARIEGDFKLVSLDAEKIVLSNTRCPFGDRVLGRKSLCMMTSTVFGTISAENNGYARVVLEKTIAAGDGCCSVVVYLQRTDTDDDSIGVEYFAG